MQRRKVIGTLAAPAMIVGLILAGGGASSAAPAPEADPGYVIITPTAGIQVDADRTFYPISGLDKDTLVVIAEPSGKLPNGLTIAKLDQIVAQNKAGTTTRPAKGAVVNAVAMNRTYLSSGSVNWSQAFVGQSIAGNPSLSVQYNFNVAYFTSQVNVGQGRGWYQGYNGSQFGIWAKWYNLGSSSKSKTGGAVVPWGNVLATAQFRAKCSTSTVCNGHWGP